MIRVKIFETNKNYDDEYINYEVMATGVAARKRAIAKKAAKEKKEKELYEELKNKFE